MSRKLEALLKPTSLTITNESSLHAGHVGNPTGAPDAETHFRVEAVAEAFAGQSLVQRHRMVYSAVQEELDGGVHALALSTRTPEEEARRNKVGSGQAAK